MAWGKFRIDHLIREVGENSDSALERLKEAISVSHQLEAVADQLVDHFVEAAREEGLPWTEIGEELGMSKQAAQQRFRSRWFERFRRLASRVPTWHGFTDRARNAVALAHEEARRLDHNYVGTEHILLGLLRERHGVAATALIDLGIAVKDVRAEIEAIIGRGEAPLTGPIPFTPQAKRVLKHALEEAQALGHNYIGTEHILLGLSKEPEGIAGEILTKRGATQDRLRRKVISLLAWRPPAENVS